MEIGMTNINFTATTSYFKVAQMAEGFEWHFMGIYRLN